MIGEETRPYRSFPTGMVVMFGTITLFTLLVTAYSLWDCIFAQGSWWHVLLFAILSACGPWVIGEEVGKWWPTRGILKAKVFDVSTQIVSYTTSGGVTIAFEIPFTDIRGIVVGQVNIRADEVELASQRNGSPIRPVYVYRFREPKQIGDRAYAYLLINTLLEKSEYWLVQAYEPYYTNIPGDMVLARLSADPAPKWK